jgi:hypothetical protein
MGYVGYFGTVVAITEFVANMTKIQIIKPNVVSCKERLQVSQESAMFAI